MGWIAFGVIVMGILALLGAGLAGGEGFLSGGFLGFIVLSFLFYPLGFANHNERVITCHVTEKDRGGDNGSYRVYTEDCGTLANRDQWFRGKTNSADVWNEIKPGQTQRFHVVGWRFELFSDFPNVLEVVK